MTPAQHARSQLGDAMTDSHQLGEPSRGQSAPQGHPFSKSEFFRRPLPTEAIAALVENFSGGRVSGYSRELDFTPWGGAYNRLRADATAFVHRHERVLLKHAVVVDPDAPPAEREAARHWLARSWASVHPWGSGRVYPNFPDPDLEDWAYAYYGSNYDRLVRAKERYDPDEFFHSHQSLPLTPPGRDAPSTQRPAKSRPGAVTSAVSPQSPARHPPAS